MIYGVGDSPMRSRRVLWKSRAKGEGVYTLMYDVSGETIVLSKRIDGEAGTCLNGNGECEAGSNRNDKRNDVRNSDHFIDVSRNGIVSTSDDKGKTEVTKDRKLIGRIKQMLVGIRRKCKSKIGLIKGVVIIYFRKVFFNKANFGKRYNDDKEKIVFKKAVKSLNHLTPWPFGRRP